MTSLPQEFLALCRQLGDAQQRCSATLAAQAAEIKALQADVLRLRAAVVVRDTLLAVAQDEIAQLRASAPGLPRRRAMARQIGMLAERIASLSRECLRWQFAAAAHGVKGEGPAARSAGAAVQGVAERAPVVATDLVPAGSHTPEVLGARGFEGACETPATDSIRAFSPHAPVGSATAPKEVLDAHLAAADLVICQTGCISHDEYWRVQDHCRRTGKPCILVDPPLAARGVHTLAPLRPMVVLRMARPHHAGDAPAAAALSMEVLDKNGL